MKAIHRTLGLILVLTAIDTFSANIAKGDEINDITAPAADLVIHRMRHRPPHSIAPGVVGVRVTADVRNAGSVNSGPFKVTFALNLSSINDASDGPEATWFMPVHVWVHNLAPGEIRAVTATVRTRRSWFAFGIDVIAVADSCIQDALMAAHCRVPETNEHNNFKVIENIKP